jgi:hypothetical protein
MHEKDGRGKRPGAPIESPSPKEQGREQSKERQPLPKVWDILARRARVFRLWEEHRMGEKEYLRQQRKTVELLNNINKRGTPREKLIMALHREITKEPGNLPVLVWFRELSPDELQQFRSKVEPLSDDEIREEIRKKEDENKRRFEEACKNLSFPSPWIRV